MCEVSARETTRAGVTMLAGVVLASALGLGAPARVAGSAPLAATDRRIPEAKALRACAGAGAYWPTMTLALSGNTAWVACKEQRRLVRMNLVRGRKNAVVRLDGSAIAVAAGLGSVWALDSSTLYRVNPNTARVTRRIRVPATAPYNIWIGGGSVWIADDQGAQVLRISPTTGKVVARIPVGDGPADMAFATTSAWVINHRDRTLFRIQMKTNAATRLATLGEDAPERLAILDESLWVTGRGTPLLQVDPETGATRRSINIGGTGIDIVAAAGVLWVPVRTPAVDRAGFPTMTALRRVTTAGTVTTVGTTTGRVDVHGLAIGARAVWIADNTDGFLYRIPT
jgi:hypothetical protein